QAVLPEPGRQFLRRLSRNDTERASGAHHERRMVRNNGIRTEVVCCSIADCGNPARAVKMRPVLWLIPPYRFVAQWAELVRAHAGMAERITVPVERCAVEQTGARGH